MYHWLNLLFIIDYVMKVRCSMYLIFLDKVRYVKFLIFDYHTEKMKYYHFLFKWCRYKSESYWADDFILLPVNMRYKNVTEES